MPLSKIVLKPGLNRDDTSYSGEGGFYTGDKIRFVTGFAEKIGGWINQSNYTYKGVARSLWNWITLLGDNLLGVGTNCKFYVEMGGQYNDITPLRTTVTLGANPFAMVSGSQLITVTAASNGSTAGSFVTFSGATAAGGLTLNGEFEIITTPSGNTYNIISPTAATSTTSGGGSSVVAAYQLNAGNSVYSAGTGWGVGPWSGGGWGSASTTGIPLQLWSQINFDEDLLLGIRTGAIYWWTKDTSTFARAITLNAAANLVTKATTTATFSISATTITVADNTGITSGSVISGTNITSGTYVTTAYAGGLSVTISAATTGSSSGNYTFSYAGYHVPNETLQITTSSNNAFTISMGSNPYDPTNFGTTFDPMLVRWSDQDNPYEWVPEVTNQSGEQRLSNGSVIMTSANTRQEILIWTDTSLFSMQYLGPPYVWGINLLMDNLSIISPNAAISVNNVTYWMGVDKFYAYTGRVDTLPSSVRMYVFNDLNKEQQGQVVAGTNEGFNEVWWFYPSGDSVVNDSYVIYNYLEQIWYFGTMNRTAWLDSPMRLYPMAAFSVQNSYIDTAINSSITTITLLNGSSYPSSGTVTIDSEQITYTGINGNTLTGCTRGANSTTAASHVIYSAATYLTPNQIMFHEYGCDDQSETMPRAIDSYIDTSDFDIGDGHNFAFIWRVIPDMSFDTSTGANPVVNLVLKPRINSGSAYSTGSSPTVTNTASYPVELYTGQVYTRVRGRQLSFRVESDTLGVAWQMGSMRLDIRQDGRR